MTVPKQTLFEQLASQKANETESNSGVIRFSLYFKGFMLIATAVVLSFFFTFHFDQSVADTSQFMFNPGHVWTSQNVKAPFTFPVYKSSEQYSKEVSEAIDATATVYSLDQQMEPIVIERIIQDLRSLSILNNDNVNNFNQFNDKSLRPILVLSVNQKESELKKIERECVKFVHDIYAGGFVNTNINRIETPIVNVKFQTNKIFSVQKNNLHDKGLAIDAIKKFADEKFNVSTQLVVDILSKHLQPNMLFSEDLTEKAKELSEISVPKTIGIVRKGETIIRKGDLLTDDIAAKLNSLYTSKNIRDEYSISFLSILGSFGHSTIILSILLLYTFFIRKRIFADNYQLGLILFLLIVVSAMAWLTVELSSSYPYEYLIFLPTFVMLAAIVFDSRTAFYVTITMALLITGIRGNDYGTGTAMLFAGTLAAYTVKDIQSRTQMFQSIFWIFIGLVFAIIIFGLERSIEWHIILKRSVFALINAATAPLITFGMLFLLERVSNIATDLRIKEYDNLNHPLLLKMSESAPGTYQHTLGVAMLAERVAQVVGANPLLIKVGAYFHDIGKIAKAEYFTENQLEMENKHDQMQPKRSAAAIREHVNDGIELARQYKLPQRIIDFIPMHHGTSLIRHFYAKALEEAAEKAVTVNEKDFRYPGPRPNSKETAILMVCDTAEAISRVADLDKDEIEKIIDKTIKEKILDGQFDECNITMIELQKAKEVIAKNLLGKTHQRVKYKEIPKTEEE